MPFLFFRPSLHTLGKAFLVGVGVAAGYVFVGLWWATHDTTPLTRICQRIDYINGLHKQFGEDVAEEVRTQLKAAIEDCAAALHNRAAESG